LTGWAQHWQHAASAEFLSAYGETATRNAGLLPDPKAAQVLLEAYLLEKALYEVSYELNHRPDWLRIPISGILTL
jgi:maltose alpha-D-glucosyltransferase/alpha-amylase